VRCPACQTINPGGARFCIQCGIRLAVACPNCGAVNPLDARFCAACGAQLGRAPSPAATDLGVPEDGMASNTRLPALLSSSPPVDFQQKDSLATRSQKDWLMEALIGGEERRVVSVLFADLVGSTAIAEQLDPEDMRVLLVTYFATMSRAIHRHGGTVEKFIGDAIMAVFGVPVAHEDDPVRAVRAAVDMLATLRAFNASRRAEHPDAIELQVRIGITTGEVIATTDSGDGQDFLVTGDTVNIAARLQQAAPPGGILVGERTYWATRMAFIYQPMPPLRVKGKDEPLRIWQVVLSKTMANAVLPLPRMDEGLRTPLVGRDTEMALLRIISARIAAERRPHLVTILGAPGVGKSRLWREFRDAIAPRAGSTRDASTPTVLVGRCPSYGPGITYWPLREILWTWCGITEADSAAVARDKLSTCVQRTLESAGLTADAGQIAMYLGYTIGLHSLNYHTDLPPANSVEMRDALMRAWRIFFEALAHRGLLVLVIDDIHWADNALLDLLEYLTQRTSGPLLILCSARPDLLEKRPGWGGGKRNFTTIALEPLSPTDSKRLITALLPGEEVPATVTDAILARAEGNPFFMEEIVKMLSDRGLFATGLMDKSHAWTIALERNLSTTGFIPDTVQGVIAARIDLLAPDEKRVLQHAAIIGRTFWLGAVTYLASDLDQAALLNAIEALVRRDFIQESDQHATTAIENDRRFKFRHVLTRDVAYASIPRARRAREHARMGEWLEQRAAGRLPEFAELLAYHYQQAATAWPQLLQGELSSEISLDSTALRQKAITYLLMAGDRAASKYATEQAIRLYTEALGLSSGAPTELVYIYKQRGIAHFLREDGQEAWDDWKQALMCWQRTEPRSPEIGVYLYGRLCELATRFQGWFTIPPSSEEVRTLLDAGFALIRDQPESPATAMLLTAEALWLFRCAWGQPDQDAVSARAIEQVERAAHIAANLNSPVTMSAMLDALSIIYSSLGDYHALLHVQERRLGLADAIRDRAEVLDIYQETSRIYRWLGEYEQALSWAQRAHKLAETFDSPWKQVYAIAALLLVHFDWDHLQEVRSWGEQLISACEQWSIPTTEWPASSLAALAIACYRMCQDEAGDRYSALSERATPGPQGSPYSGEFLYYRLRLAQRTPQEALRLARQLLPQKNYSRLPQLLAELAEVFALGGDTEHYTQIGPEALAAAEQGRSQRAVAQALRARGIHFLNAGSLDEAEADLTAALAIYQRLGTAWEEGQTYRMLGALYSRRNEPDSAARAREYLKIATSRFEEVGAICDADCARDELARATARSG